MAIYNAVPPPQDPDHPVAAGTDVPPPQSQTPVAAYLASQSATAAATTTTTTTPIDIEAWTVSALESLSVSPAARGTGGPLLSIDLDQQQPKNRAVPVPVPVPAPAADDENNTPPPPPAQNQNPPIRRPLSRRDSQKKRDALLKGSEGSRQRRRWENDRLVGVPNAQPPLPGDWQVRPTHPVHVVPYQVAQLWDAPGAGGLRQRTEEKTSRLQAQRKRQQRRDGTATGLGAGEEPVRAFLARRGDDSDAEGDSDDDEIVFVGRRQGTAANTAAAGTAGTGWKKARREVASEPVDTGMVFDALGADDEGASFKRWLTHSISDYYGLQSHSVTTGEPARKVVYVTLRDPPASAAPKKRTALPRPLWEMC
ncbi:hypothetical protein LX36DRAFT_572198 [Colletotrichum falcatum]|nr:hypothetical protein LX36DRAFT_572198 [Colletotrichum falcatum]